MINILFGLDQSDKRSSSKQSNQDKSEGFNLKNLEKRADSRQTNKSNFNSDLST